MTKRTYKAAKQAVELNNKLLSMDIQKGKRQLADMLVTLYSRQEEIEKMLGTALYQNQKGFNKADSAMGVKDAEYILQHMEVTNEMLVRWFAPERGSSKIGKYWRQFANA